MVIAKEASVGAEWRWMCRLQHEMLSRVDKRTLALCITAPEDEYYMLFAVGDELDDIVGEGLPSMLLMRTCGMLTYGEGGIEEQDSLLCPTCEIA